MTIRTQYRGHPIALPALFCYTRERKVMHSTSQTMSKHMHVRCSQKKDEAAKRPCRTVDKFLARQHPFAAISFSRAHNETVERPQGDCRNVAGPPQPCPAHFSFVQRRSRHLEGVRHRRHRSSQSGSPDPKRLQNALVGKTTERKYKVSPHPDPHHNCKFASNLLTAAEGGRERVPKVS